VRSAAGWVGLGASALVTATSLLASPGVAPVAHAFDCPDAEVIFARGTNEPAGLGKVGDAFVDSLRQQTGLNILPYGVNYAASKLQLHGGDGANDTIDRVKKSVETCPNTKIVLGGYSQGASVMDIVAGVPIGGINFGSTLPPQYANNIAAVVTFGDVADRAGGANFGDDRQDNILGRDAGAQGTVDADPHGLDGVSGGSQSCADRRRRFRHAADANGDSFAR